MRTKFLPEEEYLFYLLKDALTGENSKREIKADWNSIIEIAQKHKVLPLLYDVLNKYDNVPKKRLQEVSQRTVLQSYRLLFLTRYVVELLTRNEIPVIVLKGAATASFYPVPELRKSGDVDLFFAKDVDLKKVKQVMQEANFTIAKEQHANHHLVCTSPDGIDVELHVMISEPFSYTNINHYLEKEKPQFQKHQTTIDSMGIALPALEKTYHAFQLLLHMLQHFLYAGFGLKLLCDWVVIWNTNWKKEEKKCFFRLIHESGTYKFAEVITAVCVKYLGLNKDHVSFLSLDYKMADQFVMDILEAEEFGAGDTNRMVMMSGSKLTDYIREFHHQMNLNYPKLGRIVICWPVLWFLTLIRFFKNNRKVRHTSAFSILKKAGNRSKLMESLRLFEIQ
jgi:hypothetical protein